MILEKGRIKNGLVLTKEALMDWMEKHSINREFGEVIVIAGAGDIDTLVPTVKEKIIANMNHQPA